MTVRLDQLSFPVFSTLSYLIKGKKTTTTKKHTEVLTVADFVNMTLFPGGLIKPVSEIA